ncbi:reverse transcriptase [Labeo rohita]|uniref:Reverse transcriptase n=1 Tax=Labeo rohita TaxID=84645 RepID=A0A498N765_LABRO|nr:reverse transcriptase [Labeo rohita]
MTSQLRECLCRLRRAESTRKRRKDRENKRSQFTKDPFRFTRTLLGEAKSGRLTSPREVVEAFLRETHNDIFRNQVLEANPNIVSIDTPVKELNISEPSWKEIQEVVKKARSGSAPGPSGIPYKVYKKCPMLLRRLWKLFQRIWKKGNIPSCWKKAEGCFVPKEENSSTIDQFRTISLLSVECKIFFSVLAKRMTSYMTENGYINTAIQKGGIPGFSGCLEHIGVLSQMIQETKASNGNLTVVWLDLANAYGSIPHALIHAALDHYLIPQHIKGMIISYFGGIQLRFKTGHFTTQWQNLEKGIVTGCTISPILFIMGMNLIIAAAGKEARGPKMQSGIRQPPIRGYMDDLTVTTTTHVEARWVLTVLDRMATWARMRFKPKKSRYMVIRKGKLTNRVTLHVQGEVIPSLKENPIKCLEKWFDDSLTDRKNISCTEKQTEEWLRKIEKSGLPGKFKAWLYQHGLLSRLMWLLTVYEVPMTSVERVERKINKYLRRWLGIPPSFTSVGLYIRSGQLQLPLSSVVEEFKVAKCRVIMTYRDSQDEQVRQAGILTRSGRKWAAASSVAQAETMGKAGSKDRRAMIQEEVRNLEEEGRRVRAVELASQGAWTKWDLPKRKITWGDLWRLEPFRISFLLRSVYDTLPTPTNLHKWGLREDPLCKLCGERGTMAHILSGCKTALAQGRYRWRHDKVLMILANTLEQERRKKHQPHGRAIPSIKFVRAGQKPPTTVTTRTNLLQKAQSWEMKVDLRERLQFPPVVQTTLRPDAVLWSEETKKIILIELTVPWEEGCEQAFERKSTKHQDLLQDCRGKGWQAWLFPVEVGCRGFPAQSVWRMLTAIGVMGRERKMTVRRMGEAAERASCWLWSRREELSWKPGGVDGQ